MAARQDWAPVVFHKRAETGPKPSSSKEKEKAVRDALRRGEGVETVKKATAGTNKAPGVDSTKLRAIDEETEDFHVTRVSASLSQKIMQARVAKGWTQKDLAQRINEKPAIIHSYENGSAIPTPAITAKLSRVLGVPLGKSKGPKAPAAAAPKPASR